MLRAKRKILAMATILTVGAMSLAGCSKEKVKKEAEPFKISLILTEGGANDQSFNQSSLEGAMRASEKYGVEVTYLESKQKSDYISNIETAVDDSDLIIGVGYEMSEAIKEAAEAYPEQNFAIVDGSFEEIPKNVRPILFNEQEAGYSVGLIAGKMTNTNKLSFIGGMNIPSVKGFAIGFEQGAKEVNPDIEVVEQYANSFTDAAKGRAMSQQMVNNGVDIIFTAGGGVNNGVYETAKDRNIKAIGVDMPCNYIEPEYIITSALKRVDVGVELTIKDLVEGNFSGGQAQVYDLSNQGVGYEDTTHITDEVREFVNKKIGK